MPIVKMTADFIKTGLICVNKDRVEFVPDDLPGMYLLVTATSPGHGTYFHRYKNGAGKTCHIKVGRTTEISLAEARKQVIKLKGETSTGKDPQAEEKARKAVITVDEFFTEHYQPFVLPRKRSWKRDEELYRLRIKDEFGHLRLNQIDRKHVQTFHASLLKKNLSHASADHHVKLMRYALNLAVDWGMLEANPVKGISLFNMDNQVEHYLNDDQLKSLLDVLRTDANRTVCLICMWLLSTGARLNEALKATHGQIDVANRVWRIPASTSKSKRVRSVPLNDSALYVLGQLGQEHDHLFINKQTKKPYTTIMKVWDRLRAKAGLPHLRIHDLRHGFASLLVSDGRTLYEVQQILGHSDPKVTQRYAHLSNKTLQEAANSASVLVTPVKTVEAA
jgi:site-specific recombinase XerD